MDRTLKGDVREMPVDRIPYRGHYPSAARTLIEDDITSIPRQYSRTLRKTEGVDIVYKLRGLTPANFERYSDILLLLAYQEAMRYNHIRWKFASFDVRLGRLKKGRDLPEVVTFTAAMNPDAEVLVYGPGYPTPQRYSLAEKVEDVLEIAKRYADKVSKQRPFRVTALRVSVRNEI